MLVVFSECQLVYLFAAIGVAVYFFHCADYAYQLVYSRHSSAGSAYYDAVKHFSVHYAVGACHKAAHAVSEEIVREIRICLFHDFSQCEQV